MQQSKLPPNDKEIEKAIIGICLTEPSTCIHIIDILPCEDVFYNSDYKTIFSVIKEMKSRKSSVDMLTVTVELRKKGVLDVLGGAYALTKIASDAPVGANAEHYCRILMQLHIKRELIRIGAETIKYGQDTHYDVFDSLDKIKNDIKKIESGISSDKITSNSETIDIVIKEIQEAKEKGGITGYSTGIKSLDIGLMGLRRQLKYVIAAQPSVGKTSLAKTICINLAHNQGLPGVFFSMEMPPSHLMVSCISQILSISNADIQTGNISKDKIEAIREIKNTFFAKNFLIDSRPGLDPSEIRSTLRKLKDSHDIKWCAVDYLLLQKLKGREHNSKNSEAILSEITAENKNMAKEMDIVFFELTQLTKETTKRSDFRPKIGDIKGSGSIEANADSAILIYRPEHHGIHEVNGKSSKGWAEFILAKNRFGPLKSLLARYIPEYTQFVEHEAGNILQYENEQDLTDNTGFEI